MSRPNLVKAIILLPNVSRTSLPNLGQGTGRTERHTH
jgi:hypothetical protein